MEPRKNVNAFGVFIGADDLWDQALSTRRFAFSVLHRLRDTVEESKLGSTRSFDVYYVVLRRTQPTHRYARQDPTASAIPNPCDITLAPVTPKALPPEKDVLFPVPWRVQVQFPAGLASRSGSTGVPTEIDVPPIGLTTGSKGPQVMLVNMFATGTYFVDEISGLVFRVVKQRVTGAEGELAKLTLDREVVLEDLDLPANDPRCEFCAPISTASPALDLAETVRTVWVYPPPIEAARNADRTPIFNGPSPVVDIEVRSLSIVPTN